MFKCHGRGKIVQKNINPKEKGSFTIVSHEGLSVNLFSSYPVKKIIFLVAYSSFTSTELQLPMTITTILAPQV